MCELCGCGMGRSERFFRQRKPTERPLRIPVAIVPVAPKTSRNASRPGRTNPLLPKVGA
jgi:hypothetical protein